MGKERDVIPQFETEEQEAEYWDTHSPLDLAAEPKAQRVRVRDVKDRPITIRLDSESRLKLDRLAAEHGLGSSTFARLILMSFIERRERLPRLVTPDEIEEGAKGALEQMPQAIRDQAESLVKAIAIGDLENPALLLIDVSQRKELEQFTWSFLSALLARAGVQVITPENSRFEELKSAAGGKDK